jgi:catalase
MAVTPGQAVDAANKAFGSHHGFRALHARGVLLKGTFTATPAAAALTRAPHMQGDPIPATFRISNGSGNPRHPDYAPDARGFAVKLYLPDGARTDIVAVSTPRFSSRTPEGFIELLRAQSAGAAAAWKLPVVLARHPEAVVALATAAPTFRPPSSYAVIRYYGIHAFRWIGADGDARFVRYFVLPAASGPGITPWAARRRGRDYLERDLRERLERGPVRFSLEVQIAEAGDPIEDPSAPWPKSRRRVEVGTFEITEPETGRETDGDVLVFDPTRVVDGIELSDDPVLRFRADAYRESVARRAET